MRPAGHVDKSARRLAHQRCVHDVAVRLQIMCDGLLLLRDDRLLPDVRLLQLTDALLTGGQLIGKR